MHKAMKSALESKVKYNMIKETYILISNVFVHSQVHFNGCDHQH